jgi:hypothetical protein
MATRIPPKIMAKKLVRTLRPQHPDYHYLKKVFQHTRDLLAIGPGPRPKRLPDLLTEAELGALYEAIWHAQQLTSKILNFQNPYRSASDIRFYKILEFQNFGVSNTDYLLAVSCCSLYKRIASATTSLISLPCS